MTWLLRALSILALAALLAAPSVASAEPERSLAFPVGLLRPLGPPAAALGPEDRVVELVNAERARFGLAPLARQAQLSAAAGEYATAMASFDFFSHSGFDGSSVQARGEAHGYLAWTFLGENLAAGQESPERVVRAWMASPTHRANVLSTQACEVGVGRATARGGRYSIYWVMEIGCGLLAG